MEYFCIGLPKKGHKCIAYSEQLTIFFFLILDHESVTGDKSKQQTAVDNTAEESFTDDADNMTEDHNMITECQVSSNTVHTDNHVDAGGTKGDDGNAGQGGQNVGAGVVVGSVRQGGARWAERWCWCGS